MNSIPWLRGAVVSCALLCGSAIAQTTPADLTLTNLNISGVSEPIAVAQPNDGSGRLFIVSLNGGIFIYRNGVVETPAFLTVPVSTSSEQGLLGLAFHPDFANNGRFFVQHTRGSAPPGTNIGPQADQLTVEYRVSAGDPDIADPATRATIRMTIHSPAEAVSASGGELLPRSKKSANPKRDCDHSGYLATSRPWSSTTCIVHPLAPRKSSGASERISSIILTISRSQ